MDQGTSQRSIQLWSCLAQISHSIPQPGIAPRPHRRCPQVPAGDILMGAHACPTRAHEALLGPALHTLMWVLILMRVPDPNRLSAALMWPPLPPGLWFTQVPSTLACRVLTPEPPLHLHPTPPHPRALWISTSAPEMGFQAAPQARGDLTAGTRSLQL